MLWQLYSHSAASNGQTSVATATWSSTSPFGWMSLLPECAPRPSPNVIPCGGPGVGLVCARPDRPGRHALGLGGVSEWRPLLRRHRARSAAMDSSLDLPVPAGPQRRSAPGRSPLRQSIGGLARTDQLQHLSGARSSARPVTDVGCIPNPGQRRAR